MLPVPTGYWAGRASPQPPSPTLPCRHPATYIRLRFRAALLAGRGLHAQFSLMDTLAISVTRQAGGLTFSLYPSVRRSLREQFPGAAILPSIFVSHTAQQSEASLLTRLPKYLVPALTGLTNEQLAGIQQVTFVDTSTGHLLGEYVPLDVAA